MSSRGGSGPCKYFQQGRCRYGNNCSFEHIRQGGGGGKQQQQQEKSHNDPPKPEDVIRHDLFEVLPIWTLSCYGLNASWHTGSNLITGDYSPEELRLEAYSQSRTYGGNIEEYRRSVQAITFQMAARRKEILDDLAGAVQRARVPLFPAPAMGFQNPDPPLYPLGLPQNHNFVGLQQNPMGFNLNATGLPQSQAGLPQNQVGIPQNHTVMGFPQNHTAMGFPQNQSAMGLPQNQIQQPNQPILAQNPLAIIPPQSHIQSQIPHHQPSKPSGPFVFGGIPETPPNN